MTSDSEYRTSDLRLPSGLRIVFFGTPAFAAYILEYLKEAGENIISVVTTPEKQQGRGLKTRPMVMQETAQRLGIEVLAPERLRNEQFISDLKKLEPDIFCIVAYKILPKEVYAIPKFGAFNVHTSLLPKYRGAAPMNWAIINGERETGITTFLLEEKVDTGNILVQARVKIGENETVGELHDTLMHIGAKAALDTIKGLAHGTLHPRPQPNEEATPAPKIFPEDCILDFTRPAPEVHNKIRGLSPYPTAVALLPNGERLKVFLSQIPEETKTLPAGTFSRSENSKRLFVGTATAAVELLEVQRENKKRMRAEEFLRGARNIFM